MTHEELLLFGERIRDRRNSIGMTQESVAEQVNISLRFYQMIERGEKSVSLDTLMQISRTLTVSIDYLLFGNLADSLENLLTNILAKLSPQERADAAKILQLYAAACGYRE